MLGPEVDFGSSGPRWGLGGRPRTINRLFNARQNALPQHPVPLGGEGLDLGGGVTG